MTLSSFLFGTPLGQWVLALVVVVLFFLLSRVLVKLAAFAHAAAVKAEVEHRATFQTMLLRAGDVLAKCASDAVTNIEQTMRPQILGAAKDGKLDATQAKALRDAAVQLALKQAEMLWGKALQQLGIDAISSFVPTLEHAVDTAVEKVAGNSRARGVAPMPPAQADPPQPVQA